MPATPRTIPEHALLSEMLLVLDIAPDFDLYAASFSAEGNLLSQWRAYCPPTGGFSVGITSSVLERSGNKLIPCLYEPKEQSDLLEDVVGRVLNAFRYTSPPGEEEPERRIRIVGLAVEFLRALLVLAASFKERSFREEVEWRLIARTASPDAPPLFRVGRGGVVPYLEVPLITGDYLVFDQVIVGPNPHEAIAVQAVQALLDAHQVVCSGVEPCGIPYRPW